MLNETTTDKLKMKKKFKLIISYNLVIYSRLKIKKQQNQQTN